MVTKYFGETQQQAFHEEIARLIGEGHCIYSPGGAAAAVGLTRQRIHQLIEDDRFNIRAWAYYEDRQRMFRKPQKVLAYMYVSMPDLLRYAVATGRIESKDDLGAFSPLLLDALDAVKQNQVSSA
jgi:hypothetical protein